MELLYIICWKNKHNGQVKKCKVPLPLETAMKWVQVLNVDPDLDCCHSYLERIIVKNKVPYPW